MPAKKKKRELTPERFAELLALLDQDPDRAAERYMELRAAALEFLKRRFGLAVAEDLASEAAIRLLYQLAEGKGINDLNNYVIGIAKYVRLEEIKRQRYIAGEVPADWHDPKALTASQVEGGFNTSIDLERCLEQLSVEERELLYKYLNVADKKDLLSVLDINVNILRIRVYNIKKKLRQCLQGK